MTIDPSQFDQMVINLAANARDAIRGLARSTCRSRTCRCRHRPRPRAAALRPATTWPCASATPAAVSPRAVPRIFEPFFTTKPPGEGTGLGLSSVLGTVEQAGGHVEVEHTSSDGTTVLVLLPRSSSRPCPVRSGSAGTTLEGTERILLVEDEPAVLELMRRTLESYGYTVLHASTPERALRAMQEGAARVDLLLTDVVMPGMNGRELAMHLRALDPALRVLFMSGYSSDVVAEQGSCRPRSR